MKLLAAALTVALVLAAGTATAGAQQPPPGVYQLPSGTEYVLTDGALIVQGGANDCAALSAAAPTLDVWGCPGSSVPDLSPFGTPAGWAIVVGSGTVTVPTGATLTGFYLPGTAVGGPIDGTITVDGDVYGPGGLVGPPPAINTDNVTGAFDDVSLALVVVGAALALVASLWLAIRLVLRWIYSAGAAA